MKERIFSYAKAGLGCLLLAVTVTAIRYCLYAPEQFGRLMQLIG